MNTFDSIKTFDPNDHRIDGYSKPLEPGRKIGQFQNFTLVRSLGRGGMGQVWLAEEELGGGRKRNVVCKLLPMPVQDDKKSMDDLAKTFDLTSRLFHPHICPLFGMNEDPEYGFFFVMDHCEGGSLWDWFQKPENRNGIALSELLPIFRPIAEALDYAHSQHIIHRDVKPQNIMFAIRDGQRVPSLIDFGIAARVHATMTMTMPTSQASKGTPHYMPPEQFMGEKKQDGRADQYSLAASLYHLLAGNPPFEGNIYSLAAQVMQKIPDPIPTLTAAQNSALLRALAKKPDDRFPACSDFLNALSETTKTVASQPQTVQANPFVNFIKTTEQKEREEKEYQERNLEKQKNLFADPAKTLKKQLDGQYKYILNGNSVTITKYIGTATSVTIPYGVTSIGDDTFRGCNNLTSVTIPSSVTSIGDAAFKDCLSLKSVTIPDSVTCIGKWAFCHCKSLKSLTIPNSVTGIGDDAFFGCNDLTIYGNFWSEAAKYAKREKIEFRNELLDSFFVVLGVLFFGFIAYVGYILLSFISWLL